MKNSSQAKLMELVEGFSRNGEPIGVDFRALIPWITSIDRATHLIHPYPAKLLVHIPHFFLANDELSKPGDVVLDPFCGSGTVLLEAMLANRHAYGADTNPLAQLISRVKTSALNPTELQRDLDRLVRCVKSLEICAPPPDVVNINYWFTPNVIEQLSNILHCIKNVETLAVREFFLVCLSSVIRRVSLADPRLSVPVRLRPDKYPVGHWFRSKAVQYLERLKTIDVLTEFVQVSVMNIRRMSDMQQVRVGQARATILSGSASHLVIHDSVDQAMPQNTVQLVVTSPPYAGAQKYVRSSSLQMGWLELCTSKELKKLDEITIGREHYPKGAYREFTGTGIAEADAVLEDVREDNPLRAHIAATYLIEMRQAIEELHRVIKVGGYLVLVAANNQVCNREFKTFDYVSSIIRQLALETVLVVHDDIRSRSLITKRHKTAGVITKEWVGVFRKRG